MTYGKYEVVEVTGRIEDFGEYKLENVLLPLLAVGLIILLIRR